MSVNNGMRHSTGNIQTFMPFRKRCYNINRRAPLRQINKVSVKILHFEQSQPCCQLQLYVLRAWYASETLAPE